eukprot:TRINITY_DN3460_c0_g1_i2.p1 TRINITY_DN3460_c0_g1~~TRINITY_DN3460_c0_g1_i2.p1  ORF type:complete len:354 (-),score=35.67 TRINITY_DN3460_c0_g1_i2:91-1152(-)
MNSNTRRNPQIPQPPAAPRPSQTTKSRSNAWTQRNLLEKLRSEVASSSQYPSPSQDASQRQTLQQSSSAPIPVNPTQGLQQSNASEALQQSPSAPSPVNAGRRLQSPSPPVPEASYVTCASHEGYRGGGRGRGIGRGSGGGRGSFGDRTGAIDALGRCLSNVLRHKASKLGLKMRSDGYVSVEELLSLNFKTHAGLRLCDHSVEDLTEAVQRDNKQRFGLREENGRLLVRANQGHTVVEIQTSELLTPVSSADDIRICVHGTYMKNLESIKQSGLKTMGRRHVHFARGLPANGVISGMRTNCEVAIYLDLEKALKDGMKIYVSENQVILTEGFDGVVPPQYFKSIQILGNKKK